MGRRGIERWQRWLTVVLLVAATLFYLQFGLQALAHYIPQGTLSLLGAAGLGWGVVRRLRGRPWAVVVLACTAPILVLHAAMTLDDSGEMPFLIGSIPVPAAALVATRSARSR
jgi:hypothetical protein